MKKYEGLEIEVIVFDRVDVITDSCGHGESGDGPLFSRRGITNVPMGIQMPEEQCECEVQNDPFIG